MEEQINAILSLMSSCLDNEQLSTLHASLVQVLCAPSVNSHSDNQTVLHSFLDAKRIEGCSRKTLDYYDLTISKMLEAVDKPILNITTPDLRTYLAEYQEARSCSAVTINNMRRILSSFFAWLEDEGALLKSPMRRIKQIKTPSKVKTIFTPEQIEKMRESTICLRDLAILDLLSSTGVRVSELVNLDVDDFNLEKRECIVLGKGNKERTVYFDDRTKLHLRNYFIDCGKTGGPAFTQLRTANRLGVGGVERVITKVGSKAGVEGAHPHKFRRTLATRAIGKGMPIEQVQHLLGHKRIDTTMQYALVDEANVRISHRRFIC